MENNIGFKVIDHNASMYTLALGISNERAELLLSGVKELAEANLSVSERLEYAAGIATDTNEFAFVIFKLGEACGADKLARHLGITKDQMG